MLCYVIMNRVVVYQITFRYINLCDATHKTVLESSNNFINLYCTKLCSIPDGRNIFQVPHKARDSIMSRNQLDVLVFSI